MWAQLISVTVKPGREADLPRIFEELHANEQEDSGLLRTMVMRDEADPSKLVVFVLFESEEKAREREADPRRAEGNAKVRALMAEVFEMPPSFQNVVVLHDA